MKDINIGAILVKKRKEKQLTQEQLAKYLGISKTAVSKWETNQSYPDITFLPILASFFDMSVDALIDYKPQMSEEEIKHLYKQFCDDFATKSFDEVMKEIHKVIKKYHSCYQLIYHIAILYVNHAMLSGSQEKTNEVYKEARELLHDVRQNSEDSVLQRDTIQLEAYCDLMLKEPKNAIHVLKDIHVIESNFLLANAYYMAEDIDNAELTMQIDMFQSLSLMFTQVIMYLTIHMNNPDKFEHALKKFMNLDELFDFHSMNPGLVIPLYLIGMQGYAQYEKFDSAYELMERYVNMILYEIKSFAVHGKGIFDRVHEWHDTSKVALELPRSEKVIRESAVDGLEHNPALMKLYKEERFCKLLRKLKEGIRHE